MSLDRKQYPTTWLHRTSILIAGLLSTVGAVIVAGGWFHAELGIPPNVPIDTFNPGDGLCIFFLGMLLLALELEWTEVHWFAWVPICVSSLSLAEDLLTTELYIDEILMIDRGLSSEATQMSVMFAGCILLTCFVLIWRMLRRGARAQLFAEAVTGSIVASAGLSTLLGYAVGLPAIYHWGTATATAPLSAAALLVIGIGLLFRAWRQAVKAADGAPAWSPMPAVIGCLTLTLILWIGLRERERAYVSARAQTSMDTLATSIASELDRQSSAVERLARKWAAAPNDEYIWEQDARAQWEESSGAGCVSLAVVSADLLTIWAYPAKENASAISFDHANDAVRRAAIEAARLAGAPAISTSTSVATGNGAVIYSPIFREGRISGYVAAEFLYQQFFGRLIADQKLTNDYHVAIRASDTLAFNADARPLEARSQAPVLERVYPILNRPITVALTPSADALENDRLFLPELALGAGVGITLLLGLSVHLARRARAGQRSAELSNRKLQAENEERRRVEARLKISDERLRLALDSTQIGIFEWNVPAGHVYYSAGLWAMLGYDHGRMPASPEAWQNLIHPDDVSVYRRRVDSQLAGLASFIEPEYRVRARGGEWRWVYTRSKTVATQADGKPLRIIGTVQDITARREAEQALRESQAEARKLSLVASKTDNPVLIASPSGAIEWVNESFTRVMEYSLEEVVGKAPADFMDGPETDPNTVARIRAAMANGQGISTDVVNYSKSGRKYHLRLQIQPIRDETDQLQNFIAIETDITARVVTEQTLRRAKAEADEASRAKSEFVASMSHEIRTPMNGVIGMTSLLLETPLNPEQLEFINTIRTSGDALLTIINDILDFSKIESGKLELEHVPFELAVCL
ncbi:MAG TPA: PAS domain S-box protein, partial [Opitutus sp.]|nr:PAS domain S-box protein [Opitutus sp.]